ncbi:acylphosphatase [Phytopseudomonas dryadis]|uniref:Acylphosphatase n=1 Tax=Phytopseudomonas dryadis TaxID=2487520 RepID=A0A4Q9QY93_9GAMM|nr:MULTISPECIES: acylphosphatase [Pseudomonas]TBU89992.1 acylphosphatase [Pseudomonas dryadis]TBV02628.1 acylphosphatase [Pseudomonas dryadis]TBV15480.1 acylphosphatase [Pseudomonas sp. FRB 230]
MAHRCVHGYISGRVQGVGFRQSTASMADSLGLSGWVRNVADGRVELLFEGDDSAVQQMATWLETGPRAARVASVELQEHAWQGIAGFVVRP